MNEDTTLIMVQKKGREKFELQPCNLVARKKGTSATDNMAALLIFRSPQPQ
jgi:hypothetical protein